MVYDVVHATPEDPGNHCGPGAAHGCRCGPGSIECTELGGFPHVDHDNTLLSGARVWRLRTCSRQRKPSQRFAVFRFDAHYLWLHCRILRRNLPGPHLHEERHRERHCRALLRELSVLQRVLSVVTRVCREFYMLPVTLGELRSSEFGQESYRKR